MCLPLSPKHFRNLTLVFGTQRGHVIGIQAVAVQNGIEPSLYLESLPSGARCCCVKTVSKLLLFGALELYLSEKQMPQVVGFIRSRQNQESFQKGCACAQGRCATRLRYAPTVVQLTFNSTRFDYK